MFEAFLAGAAFLIGAVFAAFFLLMTWIFYDARKTGKAMNIPPLGAHLPEDDYEFDEY